MREINSEELESLKSEGKKIFVDFFAVWCGPCKILTQTVETFSDNFPNVEFVKIDIDKEKNYVVGLGIKSVPTVMIFKGTESVDVSAGTRQPKYYIDILKGL
jgi:thioredoxin 1